MPNAARFSTQFPLAFFFCVCAKCSLFHTLLAFKPFCEGFRRVRVFSLIVEKEARQRAELAKNNIEGIETVGHTARKADGWFSVYR